MLLSYNWLKQYLDLEESPQQVADILTRSGLEVETVESKSLKDKLDDKILVGHVLECYKHPEADKLSVCKVDTGAPEALQIICGAPNVAKGQKVVVATVGSVLTNDKGESLKIKKAKLRGIHSMGMICAEDELGLGTDHDGIMVLDNDAPVGVPFKTFFKDDADTLIEIAIIPNRGDAISHIGAARDIAAVLGKKLKYPTVDGFKPDELTDHIKISAQDKVLCPRYSAVILRDIIVKESPEWLQTALKSIGLKPVNNIVDACNYLMFENGQPLHAFDYDKLEGGEIVVKTLDAGTKFKCLDEQEVALNGNEIMICDAKKGIAMGGVMGGYNSMVVPETRNILIESAYFNQTAIRKASKHHLLLTDAAYRFERGTDPNFTAFAAKRAAMLIKEVAGGKITSDVLDYYPEQINPLVIKLEFDFVRKVLGNNIENDTIKATLEALEYIIKEETEHFLQVEVPTYRTDVLRPIDLVEEVLRIYSYDQITFGDQLNAVLPHESKLLEVNLKEAISNFLTSNGFYEILTPSFIHSKFMDQMEKEDRLVKTINAVNANLNTLRHTFMFSALESISFNLKRKQEQVFMYEFGKVYNQYPGKYLEAECLGLWLTGKQILSNWFQQDAKADFYYLKAYVYKIIQLLKPDAVIKQKEAQIDGYEYALNIKAGKLNVATLGKIDESKCNTYDIDHEVFYAELNVQNLIALNTGKAHNYKEPSKYPGTSRDLALELDKNVSYEAIKQNIRNLNFPVLKDILIFDKYEGEHLADGKKSYAIRFVFQDEDKTLQDVYIEQLMSKIISSLEKQFNARLRQ